MPADWSAVTSGGVLALLVLREVFAFLKVRKANGSGERPVEYWTQEIRKIVREELRDALEYTLRHRP